MNEKDFVTMIDEHIASFVKYPKMYGSDAEIESALHILFVLKARVLGHDYGHVTKIRHQLFKQNNLQTNLSLSDQVKDEQFLEIMAKYIVLLNTNPNQEVE